MRRLAVLSLMLLLALGAVSVRAEQGPIAIDDGAFAKTMLEIGANLAEYDGRALEISGYVVRNSADGSMPFSIYRDFNCCGGTDFTPYGFDCAWDGEIPEDGAWVTAVGAIGSYKRANGYTYLMLTLTSLEETEPGNRIVTG